MSRLTRAESMAVTREKLLAAATDTFASVGFTGATVEGIAEGAGYSRGAFYAHFGSKDDILLAVVEAQSDGVTPQFLGRIEQAADADEAIEAVVSLLVARGRSQGLARAVMDALHEERLRSGTEGRYAHLVTANWRDIGEALRRFFPAACYRASPTS